MNWVWASNKYTRLHIVVTKSTKYFVFALIFPIQINWTGSNLCYVCVFTECPGKVEGIFYWEENADRASDDTNIWSEEKEEWIAAVSFLGMMIVSYLDTYALKNCFLLMIGLVSTSFVNIRSFNHQWPSKLNGPRKCWLWLNKSIAPLALSQKEQLSSLSEFDEQEKWDCLCTFQMKSHFDFACEYKCANLLFCGLDGYISLVEICFFRIYQFP